MVCDTSSLQVVQDIRGRMSGAVPCGAVPYLPHGKAEEACPVMRATPFALEHSVHYSPWQQPMK